MNIWHKPEEIPNNGSLVLIEFNNNIYCGCIYHQNNTYSIVDASNDVFWKSEIDRWCYINDIKNLK